MPPGLRFDRDLVGVVGGVRPDVVPRFFRFHTLAEPMKQGVTGVVPWLEWLCRAGPERALHWHEQPLALCARCLGLYAAITLALALSRRRSARDRTWLGWLVGAAALNVVQVTSELWCGLPSSAWLRVGLGAALGTVIGSALATRLPRAARRGLVPASALVWMVGAVSVLLGSRAGLAIACGAATVVVIAALTVLTVGDSHRSAAKRRGRIRDASLTDR